MTSLGPDRFYITTAIDYPNGAPHIGHAYEKIVADAYARWHRYIGDEVFFVTGTDENGQKLQQAAKDADLEPAAFVEQNQQRFRELFAATDVSYSDFIRTSSARNIRVVRSFWQKMVEVGDIYFDRYKGNYCLACETFYADSQAADLICPVHMTPLKYMEEEGYFFKLSKYQAQLIDIITNRPDFLFPKSVRSEMLSRLESEKLLDLSISRRNTGWGIPVPDDPKHVIYTWYDALISYYAATCYDDVDQPIVSPSWWPAAMHVIGKDISWFHAVIWPAMLLSVGQPLPKQIYVHGMILGADGRRMSKSLGNGVDPVECLASFAVDTFRYFMLKAVPSGQDAAFGIAELVRLHNSDLANDLGNLLMRTVKLSLKYLGTRIEPVTEIDFQLDLFPAVAKAMEQREHHRALGVLWDGVRQLNCYLNEKEPWRNKADMVQFHRVMYTALVNLRTILRLLEPFLPSSAAKALATLGREGAVEAFDAPSGGVLLLQESAVLFPRYEI